MMARAAQRERAIQAVIRTGRTPRRNVKWSEFCDLVRAAARVLETQEEFPRGWSNAAIMNAAKKISRRPAVLCERCKAEIALANALDAEQDVDRQVWPSSGVRLLGLTCRAAVWPAQPEMTQSRPRGRTPVKAPTRRSARPPGRAGHPGITR